MARTFLDDISLETIKPEFGLPSLLAKAVLDSKR